jgi:hypothetical protein
MHSQQLHIAHTDQAIEKKQEITSYLQEGSIGAGHGTPATIQEFVASRIIAITCWTHDSLRYHVLFLSSI